ncbi:UPF0728 protein-like [Haliotis cracherodii]|uniref:UPF0728 protein-like n=1 Tax=Haliotis rufescens TaxID=6454 RepID=UPI001EB01B22|nr:UPF0728 protein-like [Haliotis rufescens]
MPAHAKVFIHYGPYEACGIVDHKESRLEGLRTVLRNDGHSSEMVQIDDRNTVNIFVNGEQVYKCDIRDLDYGGDGGLDVLCKEALAAVRRAF